MSSFRLSIYIVLPLALGLSLLTGACGVPVAAERLKELSIKLDLPKPKVAALQATAAAAETPEGIVSPKGAQ